MQLELKQLHIDGGTQPRVAINEDTVAEYAEALKDGATFPPVVAFHDGHVYWLADGFHRYLAHRRVGVERIEVDVREGSLRDAILFAVGANAEHGLKRTNEDKHKAVVTLLTHELAKTDTEGHPWSNMEIARRCRVNEKTVRKYRDEVTTEIRREEGGVTSEIRSEKHPQPRAYTSKHGTKATMNTANIGRARKAEPSSSTSTDKSAVKRCKFHAEDGPVPMRIINLPLNNPDQAAKSLISVYGEEYVRKVNAKLNQIFQNKRKA